MGKAESKDMSFTTLVVSLTMLLSDTLETQLMRPLEVQEDVQGQALRSTAPHHVLDTDALRRLGVTDISGALHRLPGITLRDYGGAGGMKTVSVRGFGAKHTGVSYDGLMVSDCQSGEIDLARYSLDNVQHLSLTIGDNEELFVPARQASVPALLSLETIAPPSADRLAHATVQMRAGSFGYVNPYLRYGQSFNNRLAIAVEGDYVHADNQYPFTLHNLTLTTREKRTNSRMDAYHTEAAFVWQASQRHALSGKAYWWDNDRQLPGQVRYYTNLSRETLHEQNSFGQLRYLGHLGHGLSLKASGKFNWSMSDYRNPLYPGGVLDAQYWQREYYTTAALLYVPSSQWAFDYSADYAFNNLNSSLPTDRRPFRHTVWQTLTAKFRTDRLTATARLLHSLYLNRTALGNEAKDISHLSPSLSLAYRLLPAHELYARASYKDIFRAPTFNESYFFHYGSTDLRPERTHQLNLGLTWQQAFTQTELRLTADGYFNEVKDKILAIPVNMFIWRCINLSKVRVLGFDATANIVQRLNSRHTLLAAANYSLQRATNRTNADSSHYGKQIAYVPMHTAGLAVSWENPWVSLSVHGQAVSHRYSTHEHYDGTRISGYNEWTASAYRAFHIRRHTIEARAELRNIFNRQYEIVALYPMPGRSYMFTLKYSL